MARRVPISRVRSRMAIHMVFMMPVTTMAMRMISSTVDSPCSACKRPGHERQLVLPGGDVQLLPGPVLAVDALELHPEGLRVGLHHPVAGLAQRLAQARGQRARARRRCFVVQVDVQRPGGVGAQLVQLAQGLGRARRRSRCSAARCRWAMATTRHVDGVVGPAGGLRRDGEASPTLTSSFSSCFSNTRMVPGCARSSMLPLLMLSTSLNSGSVLMSMPLIPACIDPLSEMTLAQPRPRWTAKSSPAWPSCTVGQHLRVVGHHRRRLPGRHLEEAAHVEVAGGQGGGGVQHGARAPRRSAR